MGCNASTSVRPMNGHGKPSNLDSVPKPATAQPPAAPSDNGKIENADSRCPLTSRQKFNMVKSWKGIARNIEGTGILMFIRLFETNDEVRTMFNKMVLHEKNNENNEQLRDNKDLENHVKQVMYTLDEAISSMDDVAGVIELLHSVGRGHQYLSQSGFNPKVFYRIEEPFLVAVKDTLGDRYTANMEQIYTKTIKFILETLIEGFHL